MESSKWSTKQGKYDFLKIKLDFTTSLFHNFVFGVHNLVYGEKIETAFLELLFLKNEGCA